MRAGIGSGYPTWEQIRLALEAHAKEAYGDDYVLQDFVIIGYVFPMSDDSGKGSEYIMATSTSTSHIVDGLLAQVPLFRESDEDEED